LGPTRAGIGKSWNKDKALNLSFYAEHHVLILWIYLQASGKRFPCAYQN